MKTNYSWELCLWGRDSCMVCVRVFLKPPCLTEKLGLVIKGPRTMRFVPNSWLLGFSIFLPQFPGGVRLSGCPSSLVSLCPALRMCPNVSQCVPIQFVSQSVLSGSVSALGFLSFLHLSVFLGPVSGPLSPVIGLALCAICLAFVSWSVKSFVSTHMP